MATTVLKMPPAVPAASSTSASEIFIRSKNDALLGGAALTRGVIRIAPGRYRKHGLTERRLPAPLQPLEPRDEIPVEDLDRSAVRGRASQQASQHQPRHRTDGVDVPNVPHLVSGPRELRPQFRPAIAAIVTDLAVEVTVKERECGYPQDDSPAGPQEPADFSQGAVVVLDVLEDVDQYHAVEGTAGGGRVDGSVQGLHRLLTRESLAQPADAPLGEVGGDNPLGRAGQHRGESPVTRADLQHLVAQVRLDELEDPSRVVVGAVGVVERGRPLPIRRREVRADSRALPRPSPCHRTTVPEAPPPRHARACWRLGCP